MMSERQSPDQVAGKTPGVVDTIGLAFGLLNQRPYLIWVILLVDVALWSNLRLVVHDWPGQNLWQRWASGEAPSIELAGVGAMLTPTLFDTIAVRSSEASFWTERVIVISGVAGAGAIFGFAFVALFVLITNLMIMSKLVRREPILIRDLAIQPIVATLKTTGAMLLGVLLVVFLMIPFLLVGFGLEMAGIEATALIVWAAILLGGWLGLFFLFSGVSLADGESAITKALQRSYRVVQQNFLGLIGLLLIFLLIRLGVPFALSPFVESNWSAPFAIVVNAYLATGLIASLVLFFQLRAQLIEPADITGSNAN
ncbi:MAG: hypothetical protein EA415_08675 [Sphaerobacteraceae bacterium]|nr:MAG: hypothetical protein EA415_08675 [Sphaerobacteraceae bacterium]